MHFNMSLLGLFSKGATTPLGSLESYPLLRFLVSLFLLVSFCCKMGICNCLKGFWFLYALLTGKAKQFLLPKR